MRSRRANGEGSVFPYRNGFAAYGSRPLEAADVVDEVAAWLPGLGGYGEYALASAWTIKPPAASFVEAAALPVAVEAAVGVLDQLGAVHGETLLILGGAGSVGIIATQLAVARKATVIAAANQRDHELLRKLGATPSPMESDSSSRFARSPLASMVRGREEIETLSPRVMDARFEENELLSSDDSGRA